MEVMSKIKLKSKRAKKNDINKKKTKMARYLTKGLKLNEACILANVSKIELAEMRSDVDFEDFVQRSQVLLEVEQLENISEAGSMGTWQASAWILERLYPEKYGKKDTIEHKYEIKLVTFQNVVLSVINECAPQLKQKIMQKLKSVNIDDPQMLENNSTKIIDVECVD
jgi:hypothetical protein